MEQKCLRHAQRQLKAAKSGACVASALNHDEVAWRACLLASVRRRSWQSRRSHDSGGQGRLCHGLGAYTSSRVRPNISDISWAMEMQPPPVQCLALYEVARIAVYVVCSAICVWTPSLGVWSGKDLLPEMPAMLLTLPAACVPPCSMPPSFAAPGFTLHVLKNPLGNDWVKFSN